MSEEQLDEVIETDKKLTKAQYYEWALTVEQEEHAKSRVEIATLRKRNKDYEIKIAQLEALRLMQKVKESVGNHDLAKKDYEDTRQRISEAIGFDLKCCVIDPYTYKISKVQSKKGGNN